MDDVPIAIGVDDPGDGSDREGLAGPGSERRARETYHLARHGIKRTPLPILPIIEKRCSIVHREATRDVRLIEEVSEIRSEMVTRHKIYIDSCRQLDVIP